MEEREVRVVVVGDQRCGKSALISRFICDKVPSSYTPTGFDKFPCTVQLNPHLRVLYTVWDTSGSTNFDSVRPLSYSEADIFLVCFSIAEPISLYNVRSHWAVEVGKHSAAPLLLCGCQSDLRSDPETTAKLSRTGQSLVTLEQAVAVSTQIGAECYVETKALVSSLETHEVFRLAAELANPPPPPAPPLSPSLSRVGSGTPSRPESSLSHGSRRGMRGCRSLQGSNNSIPRCEEGRGGGGGVVSQTIPEHAPPPSPLSLPTSPARPSNPLPSSLLQPLHTRSASQPVRSSSPPSSPSSLHHHRSSSPPPPAPSGGGDGAELRPPLSRNPNSRSSMPSGKPPLPLPLLPKSPTDLSLHRVNNLPSTHSRLQHLLPPPEGKNYESLKSHTSTHSHGSTGSKVSTSTSSTSHTNTGPRDIEVPDTEDPQLLSNLDFVSPKAGVYRPVNPRSSVKKDKCSLM